MSLATQTLSKGEQSRRDIIEAARNLISERGFIGITVEDILLAAGVTKGKFFHHFSSKDDLFRELLHTALAERGVVRFAQVVEGCPSKNAFDRLIFLLDHITAWHKRGLPESMRLCLYATFFFDPKSSEMQEIKKLLGANSKVFCSLIENCQKAGELPDDLDPKVLALLFPSATVGGNIIGFICQERHLTVENLLEIKKLFCHLRRKTSRSKS